MKTASTPRSFKGQDHPWSSLSHLNYPWSSPGLLWNPRAAPSPPCREPGPGEALRVVAPIKDKNPLVVPSRVTFTHCNFSMFLDFSTKIKTITIQLFEHLSIHTFAFHFFHGSAPIHAQEQKAYEKSETYRFHITDTLSVICIATHTCGTCTFA